MNRPIEISIKQPGLQDITIQIGEEVGIEDRKSHGCDAGRKEIFAWTVVLGGWVKKKLTIFLTEILKHKLLENGINVWR